jgi:hypothetical protein
MCCKSRKAMKKAELNNQEHKKKKWGKPEILVLDAYYTSNTSGQGNDGPSAFNS